MTVHWQLARALLMPVSLLLYSLAAWALGSDLGWSGQFFVAAGPLSHWIIWIALAIGTQIMSRSAENSVSSRETISAVTSRYPVNSRIGYRRLVQAGERLSRSR
jgi:hypothetical protein